MNTRTTTTGQDSISVRLETNNIIRTNNHNEQLLYKTENTK